MEKVNVCLEKFEEMKDNFISNALESSKILLNEDGLMIGKREDLVHHVSIAEMLVRVDHTGKVKRKMTVLIKMLNGTGMVLGLGKRDGADFGHSALMMINSTGSVNIQCKMANQNKDSMMVRSGIYDSPYDTSKIIAAYKYWDDDTDYGSETFKVTKHRVKSFSIYIIPIRIITQLGWGYSLVDFLVVGTMVEDCYLNVHMCENWSTSEFRIIDWSGMEIVRGIKIRERTKVKMTIGKKCINRKPCHICKDSKVSLLYDCGRVVYADSDFVIYKFAPGDINDSMEDMYQGEYVYELPDLKYSSEICASMDEDRIQLPRRIVISNVGRLYYEAKVVDLNIDGMSVDDLFIRRMALPHISSVIEYIKGNQSLNSLKRIGVFKGKCKKDRDYIIDKINRYRDRYTEMKFNHFMYDTYNYERIINYINGKLWLYKVNDIVNVVKKFGSNIYICKRQGSLLEFLKT